jgi:hypothetical protein
MSNGLTPEEHRRQRRIILARQGLEDLSTRCLGAALMAIITEAGGSCRGPVEGVDDTDWRRAAHLSTVMAIEIRERVGEHLERVLSDQNVEAYLERLALQLKPEAGGL